MASVSQNIQIGDNCSQLFLYLQIDDGTAALNDAAILFQCVIAQHDIPRSKFIRFVLGDV